MRRILRWTILLLVAVTAGLFASVNTQPVHINYLLGAGELPLAYLVLLVVGVGMLIGWLAALPGRWRRGRDLRRAQARERHLDERVRMLEAEADADVGSGTPAP